MPSRQSKVAFLWIQLSCLKREILHKICSCWSIDKIFDRRSFVDTFCLCSRLFPFAYNWVWPRLVCSNFLYLLYVTTKHLFIIHWQWLVVVCQNRRHLYTWHVEFRLFPVFAFLSMTHWVWFRFLHLIWFSYLILSCGCLVIASLDECSLLLLLNGRGLNIAWRARVICFIL